MVSKKDREDYEHGQRDRAKGAIEQAIIDVSGNRPDSPAYRKGRAGEKFDEDKEKKK